MTDYILAAAVLVLVLIVVACSVVWRRASRTADALLDPWTDPTLPPRCTATHPLWGTECVKDEHADAQHCDYLGTLWVTRLSPDAQALWDAAVAEEEAIQRAREWRP